MVAWVVAIIVGVVCAAAVVVDVCAVEVVQVVRVFVGVVTFVEGVSARIKNVQF